MKIAEIFRSLQGEGTNQGKPCLFIRLAGCNLKCHWCDTPESRSGGIEMNLDSILEQVWRINPSYVCITGGEPLLQREELESLVSSLCKRGTTIDIETNGTVDFTMFFRLYGCKVPFFRGRKRSLTSGETPATG